MESPLAVAGRDLTDEEFQALRRYSMATSAASSTKAVQGSPDFDPDTQEPPKTGYFRTSHRPNPRQSSLLNPSNQFEPPQSQRESVQSVLPIIPTRTESHIPPPSRSESLEQEPPLKPTAEPKVQFDYKIDRSKDGQPKILGTLTLNMTFEGPAS